MPKMDKCISEFEDRRTVKWQEIYDKMKGIEETTRRVVEVEDQPRVVKVEEDEN